jgi:MFS family permease
MDGRVKPGHDDLGEIFATYVTRRFRLCACCSRLRVMTAFDKKTALAFVVATGVVSFFADMTYEGMRAISGPYLGLLGASGALVGTIAGGGELTGYLLRLLSGRLVERTRAYWLVAFAGYVLQMAAVPLMAFSGGIWAAAFFIVLERAGKAMRNPAMNTMMSRAGDHIGQGWAFGLHEAMDQTGALLGPLIASFVLAHHGDYRAAFLWLGFPAALTVLSVGVTWLRYPYAGHVRLPEHHELTGGLSRAFWLYTASAALFAFGFADFSLAAFHFSKDAIFSAAIIPILYAAAMGSSGLGSLIFGRWFDRHGLIVLVPGLLLAALSPVLMFLGTGALAIAGVVLWGVALGVQDAIMSAGIARLVPEAYRARAYGLFPAIYGTAWFAGSALLGVLYDHSRTGLVGLAVVAQLLAIVPLLMAVQSANKQGGA